MKLPSNRIASKWLFLIPLGIAACALLASFAAEYIFHLAPCSLCQTQRFLYGFLAALATLGVLSSHKELFSIGCKITLALIFAVSFYHSLVQLEILEDRCKGQPKVVDLASFKASLEKQFVPCSESSWDIYNVPFPVINCIFSGLLLIVMRNRFFSVKTRKFFQEPT